MLRQCVRCDTGFTAKRGAPKLCQGCRSTHGWCSGCQRAHEHSELNKGSASGGRCKACAVKLTRSQQDRKLQWLNDLKLHSGCVDCGYRAHARALDFDHLPQFEKSFDLARGLRSRSWSAIEAEVLKCEVRCANCHRVKTAERRKGVCK